MSVGPQVRAVLWDADGVLQDMPPSLEAGAVVAQIPGYLTDATVDEVRIVAVIARLGMSDRLEEILAVWSSFAVLPESLAVVAAVRSAGTPCYLATNQDSYRASRMRELTPYDDVLDGSYYSCHLGLAKPSADYFAHVADDLALAPAELLFVDDTAVNVEGARAAGLAAEQWHHEQGVDVLRDHLAAHGVSLR